MKTPVHFLALLLALCSVTFATDPYTEAGFPAADREWTAADYTKASELIQQKKLPLPTLRKDDSSALFWRMANSLNFDRLGNKELPYETRLETYRTYAKALQSIYDAYLTELKSGASVGTEIDHLVAAMLYLTRHLVLITEDQLSKIPRARLTPETLDSLKKTKAAIAEQFFVVDRLLDEKYASKDRSYTVLLNATEDCLRTASNALSDEARADLHRRFEIRHGEFQNLKNKIILGSIVTSLLPTQKLWREMGMAGPSLWP
ncbi:hypothetical protein CMV30_02620 [Nibricoccus aquaticus]|uniref:Uncharacterized protein n=1 Tax=Nibricoccus aquaticus TaxID=2576891 RepID=A0A290Q3E5_9BACT|nr:hypothetical protein [Nibricoccus aquaticus]ATC62943.1 hypothetical protein CMV30_02620 [Nibricoccus aquaticus]